METDQGKIRQAIADTAEEIRDEIDARNVDAGEPHNAIFEYADSMFGNLVQVGPVSGYDVDDLVRTAPACTAIIAVAKEDAWVEDDSGLWEGCTYGILASIAFFSLEHCLWQKLRDMNAIPE